MLPIALLPFHSKKAAISALLLRISGLTILLISFAGCSNPDAEAIGSATEPGIVTIEVDFRGQAENKSLEVECQADSTVFSVLASAVEQGELKMEHIGFGETAFVTEINGVANQKASGDNWTYRVNGELGDRSCGVFPVSSGDQIVWRFGSYR